MYLPLPSPIKGATHAWLRQITFDMPVASPPSGTAFIRVIFGAASGGEFLPDPDLAERCCVVEGARFAALYAAQNSDAIVGELLDRGFAERVMDPEEAPTPEPMPEAAP